MEENRTRNLAALIGLALFFAVAVVAVPPLRSETDRARSIYTAGQTEDVLRERNTSAFAQILGEVRATAADLMFIKTNRYLHTGVAYVPKQGRDLAIDSVDESKHFSACVGAATQIRSAAEDFRGFLGNLERTVKPYKDASAEHTHTAKTELLPWYRLMTLSNPQYIRGYRIGGSTLASEEKWRQALEFMEEGIARNQGNPQLFLLYQTLASFHLRGKTHKGYPWGDAWLDNALKAALNAYELGRKQRPPLGKTGAIAKDLAWSLDLEDDFCFSAHVILLLLREKGDIEGALQYGREMVELVPNYQPIRRTFEDLKKRMEGHADSKEDRAS